MASDLDAVDFYASTKPKPKKPTIAQPPKPLPKIATSPANTRRKKGEPSPSFLETMGSYLDTPFIMGDALYRGGKGYTNTAEAKKAWDLIRSGPQGTVNANRQYGIGTPDELADEASHGDAFSGFLRKHPKLDMLATAAAEFGNPTNAIVGPVLGAAGTGVKLVPGVKAGISALDKLVNEFHGVRKVGGVEGESAARGLLNSKGEAHKTAQELTKQIFGPDLTASQKNEVVRMSQGLKPDAAIAEHPKMPLAARAATLRKSLIGLDETQKAHPGLVARYYDNRTYFPMKGAYVNPKYDQEMLDELGEITGGRSTSGGLGVRKGTGGANAGHKKFDTLDDAMRSGGVRLDFDPAENFFDHASRRLQNVAFEKGVAKLPPSLRKVITSHDFVDPATGQSAVQGAERINAGRGGFGMGGVQARVRAEELTDGEHPYRLQIPHGMALTKDVVRDIGSPALNDSAIHPDLAKFLAKRMTGTSGADQHGFFKLLDSWNRLSRIGVISNPVVHVGWNLTNNFLAAGGDLRDLAGISQEIDHAATEAGAHAGFGATRAFGDTKAAHLLTAHPSELTKMQNVDRAATKIWDANQKLVFDKAEKAFASALYKKYTTRLGMKPAEAGIKVRKALGDYANADPNSALSQALFFYPWLKTVIPFWAKTVVTKPQFLNAPAEGIRRNNELLDPKHGDALPDYTLDVGKSKSGKERDFSAPFPQRIIRDLATPFTGDSLQAKVAGPQRIAQGHLNTGISAALDLMTTLASPARDPEQGGAYHTVFDKDAPLPRQVEQGARYLGGRAPFEQPVASPIAGAIEAIRHGPGVLSGMAGGTTYERDPARVQKRLRKVRARLERLAGKDRKAGNTDKLERDYAKYLDMRDKLER